MTLCIPFTTGKLHISNNFSYEDASVPELKKYLEPEDFEELVQRVIFLSFSLSTFGWVTSSSVKWEYHSVFCLPWSWPNVRIQWDGLESTLWIQGLLVRWGLHLRHLPDRKEIISNCVVVHTLQYQMISLWVVWVKKMVTWMVLSIQIPLWQNAFYNIFWWVTK